MDRSEIYHRPYALLEAQRVKDVKVTHSAKVSRRRLENNRYFMTFSKSPGTSDLVGEACRHLGFPLSAEGWVQTVASGWANVGSLGAAVVKDQVMYRAYFRTGTQAPGEVFGWALEWGARKQLYFKKAYTLLDIDSIAAAKPLIERTLGLASDLREVEVLNSWLELLGEVCPTFQLLRVSEPVAGRVSFDASPAYEKLVAFSDVSRFWERWCSALDVSLYGQREWIKEISPSVIQNLTIGRDGKGQLFVAIYFGKYASPLPVVREAPADSPTPSACATEPVHQGGTGGPVFALGTVGLHTDEVASTTLTGDLAADFSSALSGGDKEALYQLVAKYPEAAPGLVWTLELNGRPIYRLLPKDEFAEETYAALIEFFGEQETRPGAQGERVERVSVPGYITGWSRLPSGQTLPVLQPILRGMFSWSTAALLDSLDQPAPTGLDDFLVRLYTEFKNPGAEPRDRALNYVATQPGVFAEAFRTASARNLGLYTVQVKPHRLRGMGLEWWDVSLIFMPPARRQNLARWMAVITVDVSEPMPVFVTKVRAWDVE